MGGRAACWPRTFSCAVDVAGATSWSRDVAASVMQTLTGTHEQRPCTELGQLEGSPRRRQGPCPCSTCGGPRLMGRGLAVLDGADRIARQDCKPQHTSGLAVDLGSGRKTLGTPSQGGHGLCGEPTARTTASQGCGSRCRSLTSRAGARVTCPHSTCHCTDALGPTNLSIHPLRRSWPAPCMAYAVAANCTHRCSSSTRRASSS